MSNLYEDWEKKVLTMRIKDKKSYDAIIDDLKIDFPKLSREKIAKKVKTLIQEFNQSMLESVNQKQSKKDMQLTLDNQAVAQKTDAPKTTKTTISYNAKTGETMFESVISILQGEKITPEIVMKAHNLNPKEWQVMSFTSNSWQAQAKADEDGNPQKIALWQSKISVKPLQKEQISLQDVGKYFKKMSLKAQPKYSKPLGVEQEGLMREVNIADLHFGKLAWVGESGENYDYKIAKKRFDSIIDEECARLEKEPVEKIVFAWANDFFNSDTPDNTTTAGTQQATDMRWQKMFNAGLDSLVGAIDRLQQYAPVKTFYIASNHSRQMEYYAIKYLEAWFRKDDRVQIDANGMARHYELFGKNMIGFTHSSFEKPSNLQHLMAIEQPKMWANSTYREMHLAHIHSEKTEEKGGVIYRWLPSVTGPDQWHYDCGYVGATKRSYSFLWDKYDGLQQINVVNIHDNKKKPKVVDEAQPMSELNKTEIGKKKPKVIDAEFEVVKE